MLCLNCLAEFRWGKVTQIIGHRTKHNETSEAHDVLSQASLCVGYKLRSFIALREHAATLPRRRLPRRP